MEPQKIDLTGEFTDWSDPKKTVYRRDPVTGVLSGPDGRPITNPRAVQALGIVEAGDTPENRAALDALKPKKPSAGQPPAGQPPADLPKKKPSEALLEALEAMDPNSEAYKAGLKQLKTLLSQGN
jgi:hypothetical protein